MTLPLIPNARARRLFLARHALAEPPSGPASGAALAGLIDRIGFVQLDSISVIERAHNMILFSRRNSFTPQALDGLHRGRALWEHVTHDASLLPMESYGHWKHRFARDRATLVARWSSWQKPDFHQKFDEVLKRISDGGPVSSADVGKDEARSKGGWWDWHPSKAALEYLWRSGDISVSHRENFRKVYDLTERVIPEAALAHTPTAEETVDWACRTALDRLSFATSGELAAYWAAIPPDAARAWVREGLARGELLEAEVEGADQRRRKVVLWPATLDEVPPEPPARLRILSPFDPALRDRKRAEHLFGFRYRIEIFVPEALRTFGYYVFPVLEGAQIIGRIDAKSFRDRKVLRVAGYWPEPGQTLSAGRIARLTAELQRLARFSGCDTVEFAEGWQRAPVPDPHR
ncbi:crosslink repair DNA glycosylase YcaQ family protein [Xinfangfangia sp. CPCC 101601]|uniref:Crosslink repair DNA glycosylase YcaQ family protein n=1 Tax=Pseudogemmobacter lacusdianii TaxID=3069608 RepID=A0ABU0VXI7_9RHOB|nr:crosslink repair DNA glycosylase YcaQ family protein [Xinfangfangia sp. CPCC 101601]MDQ2066474.1 crosslink repair DNA glycosylase YcaQ family protein [Xinfangfangia sp. CPCC 101601]